MIKKIFVLCIPFLMILSCASKEEKLQNYKDYVQKIAASIKYEDGFDCIKVTSEKRSKFRSYYLENELVYINEDLSIGNRGRSANHYYFKDNKLIYCEQKQLLLKDDSLNIKSKTNITLNFYVDGYEILESEYWIGGQQTLLVENDVRQIVEYVNSLKALAEINKP